MKITKEETRNLPNGSKYYKVLLMDELGYEIMDVVGRFTEFPEAVAEAWKYLDEEIDDIGAWFDIYEYTREDNRNVRTKEFTNWHGDFVERDKINVEA